MTVKIIVSLALIGLVFGRQQYPGWIPNGSRIPNPCGTSTYWIPGGHFNPFHHTHLKNSFGWDFKSAGHVWTPQFCAMDSDKDGMTNGEELGDPNCTWIVGSAPSGPAKSHPGICEPIGSQQCAWQNFACDCLDHCSGLAGFA